MSTEELYCSKLVNLEAGFAMVCASGGIKGTLKLESMENSMMCVEE